MSRLVQATAPTDRHSFAIARASATVSVLTPPQPERTPLAVVAPGTTMITLVPRFAIWAWTAASAPWPTLTIAITAPTPITRPRAVRADRITLRRSARRAVRTVIPIRFTG